MFKQKVHEKTCRREIPSASLRLFSRMKKYLFLSAVLLGTAVATQAGGIDVRIGIPLPPLPGIVIGRPAPRVIVREPEICAPAPVIVAPPAYCPPAVVYAEPYYSRNSHYWHERRERELRQERREREEHHRWLERH